MIRFYTHKKHQKNTRHQKALKVQKTQPSKSTKMQTSEQKLKIRLKTSKRKKVAYLHKSLYNGILIELN